MSNPANHLYTTQDLYEIEERVQDLIDKVLEELQDTPDQADRRRQLQHRVQRLQDASRWLTMMQRCVKSADACIVLDQETSVTLYDYRIEPVGA